MPCHALSQPFGSIALYCLLTSLICQSLSFGCRVCSWIIFILLILFYAVVDFAFIRMLSVYRRVGIHLRVKWVQVKGSWSTSVDCSYRSLKEANEIVAFTFPNDSGECVIIFLSTKMREILFLIALMVRQHLCWRRLQTIRTTGELS